MIMLCIFFSGVCINFRQFHYFSKCKLAPHYFSKCKLAPPYFSKSNSAHHYFSKYNSERFNYSVWSNNHPWSAFILLGTLLFNGALLFFLQSAFLFLHSAFLILHSAPLKFPVWVSTYIFSLIVSQRATYLFWYNYYFNSIVWSAYLLICRVRFMMILCVSIVILILYKTFRFWPLV